MKYIQFVNNSESDYVTATAVSAWSARYYGCLPSNTEYILYTTDASNFTNDLLKKVYSSILYPPFDVDKIYNIDWSNRSVLERNSEYGRKHRDTKMFWTKFLCFLETECDGEPVIYSDLDTLCVGSIYSAIPFGDKTWSGVRWGRLICNGGFLVKTPSFDASGGSVKLQEPLWDKDIYNETYKTWKYDDEIGPVWYFKTYGDSDFLSLHGKFNRSVTGALKRGESPLSNDARVYHYVNPAKPWRNDSKDYESFKVLWNGIKSRMLKSLKME